MPNTFPENPGPVIEDFFTAETLTQSITWKHGDPLPQNVKINVSGYIDNANNASQGFVVKIQSNTSGTLIDTTDFSDGTNTIEEFLTTSIINKNIYAVFKDFEQLQEGNYNTEIFFNLYGYINGFEFIIYSASVNIGLIIQGVQEVITTDKSTYNLVYNRQNNLLTGDIEVTVSGNTSNSELTFFNNLEIFKNINPIVNDHFVFEPSIPLQGNTNLPEEGLYEISCQIKKKIVGGSPVNVCSFLINLFVLNGDLLISPDSLSFALLQSAGEIKSEKIRIINPYDKAFTVEAPYWLELSSNSGNDDSEITVSTLNSSNIPIGDYAGDIVVKFDNKQLKIPVTLSVISFVFLTGIENYNFCLDNKIINFIRRTVSARYVKATLSVRFRNEEGEKNISVPLTVPYFNGRASFDLGSKIHQYFVRIKKSILQEQKLPSKLDNKLWMYPAEVKILVEELDVDYSIVHSEEVSTMYFYPGKKPAAFPLLSNHLYKQRVSGSKYIFSYIQGLLNLSKIGVGTPNVLVDDVIARLKIEDDENKIFFPKKKVFEITPEKNLYYFTLPDGPQIINIQFENQNLCPESFTFSGHIKVNSEYSHIYDQNVLSILKEKYDVTKITTWTINTGFIVKKCVSVIDEIIQQKLCFIEYQGKVYRAFSVSQKLVYEDSSLDLIQFDLDFLIIE